MITRIWRGWTTEANADAYQKLLLTQIFPGIAARRIPGYLGIRLDRRATAGEVEFVTTMMFASVESVIAFAGDDYTTSVVPPAARAVLSRFDAEAAHYELVAGMGALTPPALVLPARA
jgi:hypothetical protein